MTHPVLIVGAGPVGLTLAVELARYRVPVRIVDKVPTRTDKSKALAVWPRTLELLHRAGCAEAFAATGLHARAVNILAGSETIAHVTLEGVESPFPYLLMLPQSDTERLLEERLEALGVTVERQTELLDFSDADGKVTCSLRHADGTAESLDAHWLVGCDGASSSVRHQLGVPFEGNTLPSRFVLADVHVAGFNVPDNELAIFWHPEGVVVFFPISPGRYRVIADLGNWDAQSRSDPTLEDMQSIVDQRGPGGVTLSACIWLSSFGINERKVADYRVGRVFLAGDSAHVHSPAGGQGMNTGMQDAFNLAWKMALALHAPSCAEYLLGSYSSERSAVAGQVLADSGRLTRAATAKGSMAQNIRNFVAQHILGLSAVRDAVAKRLSEVTVGYADSPLNAGSSRGLHGPAPGQRCIDGAPFGAGNAPRFALLAAEDGAYSALLQRYPSLLEPALRQPPDAEGVWLVRPDGYVALTARRGDRHVVDDYLRALMPVVGAGDASAMSATG